LKEKFKAEIIHLTPILASLLFGMGCALLFLTSAIEIYGVTPFPENIVGSFGNAFYFVILVGLGATLLYLLLKMKRKRIINAITSLALTTAVFMLSMIYLFAAFSRFTFPSLDAVILILSSFIAALAYFAIFRIHGKLCDVTVLCLGGALGTFLGVTIPTLSTVLILGFLAVYDTFAVYYGPVGKIARSGLDQFRGLSFSFRNIQMGLGDLTFYSMLSGHMLIYLGIVSCLASIVGILLGCFLAFKMLEKRGMFPGLPFPILFGLVFGFLVWLFKF
jgi:presenilin-like A22 family membrane protease